ncbi:MAG: methyltransferase domain-containing protein [Treponema sp.]|nr:methyltransferase domain-containing protein [Treponema sp.]
MSAHRVYPASRARSLVSGRRLLHNPERILAGLVRPGDRAADIGCGPGYFLPTLGRAAGPEGEVLAVDLQDGMLDEARSRVAGLAQVARYRFVRAAPDHLGLDVPLDFSLVFAVAHETPDRAALFAEIARWTKPGGSCLFVEPVFVPGREFGESLASALRAGFALRSRPRVALSRAVLLERV